MPGGDVDRVSVQCDQNWETFFITWLEDKEMKNVGAEDGVFVATVDPSIRILQPQTEEEFVHNCIQEKLSTVTIQNLKQCGTKGLYHFGVESKPVSTSEFQKFKEIGSKLHSFKNGTCCTQVLKQENGLDNLFDHLDNDVFCTKVEKLQNSSHNGLGCTKSRVLLEESAQKLRQLHEKHSQNAQGFSWERAQKSPPKNCPDMECIQISDSQECDFYENEKNDCANEKKKLKRVKGDCGNVLLEMSYGYGFESPDNSLKITTNLCLSRIYNILWLLPYHYPGFHSTYLYFGMTHSFFPVHVEDALTWSVNYLFLGHPKVWVIIPQHATDLLDFHLHKGGLHLDISKCRNLLGHKVLLPTINWLKERAIPYKIVVQYPGDFVVLYPSAAHFGFNLGPNIAQAVNIGTKSWIPWGMNAKKCTCLYSQIHLDVTTLVAAFRKDLLHYLLNGSVVVTPQILKGKQLLHDAVKKSCYVDDQPKAGQSSGQEVPTFKCPARKCDQTFPKVPLKKCKTVMKRHVNLIHKPIVESSQLLQKIDNLFK